MTEQTAPSASPAVRTPEWVKDAVFYQIFPDSFARSARVPKPGGLQPWGSLPTGYGYKGGDLLGVVEHLDVLADLGINAIYFCPVFQSASNHRYHTHDYNRVDPMLGGDDALRELLDEAHRRGMRIVLDGVFNHASRGFFQFNDILENGLNSAYVDWFVIKDKTRPLDPYNPRAMAQGRSKWETNYRCWWDLPPLPEFNTDNPEVRAFLLGVAERWIKFGIDGWRLDVPEDIDDEPFWQEFRRRVKAINPEAYIVGEIWHPAQEWLRGDQFDAVMNYVFNRAAQCFFGGDRLDTRIHPGGYELAPIRAVEFGRRIEAMLAMYDWQVTQVQLNLLGSHDTPRILSILGEDRDSLKLAVLWQMTMPGAPCIYYGDEVGMRSVPSEGHEGRATMSWDRSSWDWDLRDTIKRHIALRHAHPVLRRGAFQALLADDGPNVYAFMRRLGEETMVIVFNNGNAAYQLDVPGGAALADGAVLSDCLGLGTCSVAGGRIGGLVMPPRSGVVLLKG
ncbi:MAG: alpha-glucosidase C-terminal domain-containing protein [Anaerolineae bacterium]|nr:alpha-glucosidase C-terminal domain-containing protein [Anaerolineae bacterium]